MISNWIFVFSSLYTIYCIIKLVIENRINGYVILLPIIIMFFILPSFLDYVLDIDFRMYRETNRAFNDPQTSIIYNFYISAIILLFSYKAKKVQSNFNINAYYPKIRSIILKLYHNYFHFLIFIILIPLIIIIMYGELDFYMQSYMDRVNKYKEIKSINLANAFFTFSITASAILITAGMIKNKINPKGNGIVIILLAAVLVLMNFWLNGKRAIVTYFILIQLLLLIFSGLLKRKQIILSVLGGIGVVFAFIVYYGKNITNLFEQSYRNLRIDFSRDYGVKFAIFNDLLKDRPILPEPFASYMFNLTFYIPRSMWSEKPHPYAVYFTNSNLGNYGGDFLYGWGLTTSVFAEAISNIGYFGLILIPFLYVKMIDFESKSSNIWFKLFSVLITSFLLILQPIAFMPIILAYLIMLVFFRKKL